MTDHPEHGELPESDGFDLTAPSDLDERELRDRPKSRPHPIQKKTSDSSRQVIDEKSSLAWKGLEEEEEVEPEVEFHMRRVDDDDMDMTPMVDVTFLLLIFFMITASFSVIQSIEQPKPQSDQPSTIVEVRPEDQQDYVEVLIDQFNTYHITVRDREDVAAGSDLEMQRELRRAVEEFEPERLVILAHEESELNKQIATYSAARILGINNIELQTTDEDY